MKLNREIGGKTSASAVVGGRKGASGAVLNDIRNLGRKDPPESAQKPSPELDLRRATLTPGSTGRRAGNGPGLPAHPLPPTTKRGFAGDLGIRFVSKRQELLVGKGVEAGIPGPWKEARRCDGVGAGAAG